MATFYQMATTTTIMQQNFEIAKVSIPSLNEKSNSPLTSDPLIQSVYQIKIYDGTAGNISIKNKFQINNMSLNMR